MDARRTFDHVVAIDEVAPLLRALSLRVHLAAFVDHSCPEVVARAERAARRRARWRPVWRAGLFALTVLASCNAADPPALSMDFARVSFYDAPFPSDDLRTADGRIDLSGLPDPDRPRLVEQVRALLAHADGFARTGAIYFQVSVPLDSATLPDVAGSVAGDASVYVVSIDRSAPDYLQKHPVDVAFLPDGGPFGAPDLLALLPVQGLPLGSGETYAAVVTRRVRDVAGEPLAEPDAIAELAAGQAPPHLTGVALARYRDALAALSEAGVEPGTLAGLAVFTTGRPEAELAAVRADALSRPLPPLAPVTPAETFPDYCVFDSSIEMPDYQSGKPPYTSTGGAWRFDAAGRPILDHTETARVVFTVPRGPTPPGGWPLVVFVRTGGGGDRPLVDRGRCATPTFTAPITPGSGPARDLAAIGFAAVQVDGPLGGARNPNGANEDFSVFDVFNAAALRDNIRESAVELDVFAHVAVGSSFDASACGAGTVHFDASHVAIMGHSMGAWIAPIAMADEPLFGASVLSGAGASYIANVLDKEKPIPVLPFMSAMLDYPDHGYTPSAQDPGLTLLQWAAEPSDPQVYDGHVVHGAHPRSVLMLQGIVDHYILPSIANATSLALGLDEAGPAYAAKSAELARLGQTPLVSLLPLVGGAALKLPVAGNVGPHATAVVVQHPGDTIEDGHEVMFQTGAPKHQYRCFLKTWLAGTPIVVPDGREDDPCP